jgi:hypothetical protein
METAVDQLLREVWDDSKVQEVRQADKVSSACSLLVSKYGTDNWQILHMFHASFSGKAHVRLVLLALSVTILQVLQITSANTLRR